MEDKYNIEKQKRDELNAAFLEEVEKQRQSFYDFMQGLEISSVKKIASAEPKES